MNNFPPVLGLSRTDIHVLHMYADVKIDTMYKYIRCHCKYEPGAALTSETKECAYEETSSTRCTKKDFFLKFSPVSLLI